MRGAFIPKTGEDAVHPGDESANALLIFEEWLAAEPGRQVKIYLRGRQYYCTIRHCHRLPTGPTAAVYAQASRGSAPYFVGAILSAARKIPSFRNLESPDND